MNAFHFALQPLLDARNREEAQCRGALAAAVKVTAGERARTVEARAAFARAGRTFRHCAPSLPPAAVHDAMTLLTLLAEAVRCADARWQRCAEHESLARNAFAAARFERRRINALRDRAYLTFARAVERRATLVLEETNEVRQNEVSHNSATLFASSFHSSRLVSNDDGYDR